MKKRLPYFQFEPNKWENGNIQMCSREVKGLFIDLCAIYWSRLGDLPEKLVIQKLCGGNATALKPLYDENVIDLIDGYISIDFLNEQLNYFKDISDQNKKNARIGWEKRRKNKSSARNATALKPQSENDATRVEKSRVEKSRVEKNREEKRRKENTLLTEIKISDLEDFEFEYFEISKAFQNLFIKNLEEKGAPSEKVKKAKFKQFTNPIRLMMEVDKVTKEQLTTAFKFLDSREGDFWKPIILSTEKLRKNFNQLILKSKTPNGNQPKRNRTHEEIVKSAMESEAARNFRFY